MFGYIEIEKNKFYRHKSPKSQKVLVSNVSFGEKNYKYFIGYLSNAHKVKPLHMLSKTSAFVKSYDGQFKCSMMLKSVSEKMRFPASAGGSTCEIITLLVFILISARFLCFLVIKMIDLQYLRKSEKIDLLVIDL